MNSLVYKLFLSHYKLNLKPNELQYDLQDDLRGQSHKSKMILELLVEQFVTYTLFHGMAGTPIKRASLTE